jgi:hypothetical protein
MHAVGNRVTVAIIAAGVWFTGLPARGIPLEVTEGPLTFALPEGFEEVEPTGLTATAVERLFVNRRTEPGETETLIRLHRGDTPGTAAGSAEPEVKILGHYTERIAQRDVEVLSREQANTSILLRATLPLDPDILRIDLQSPARRKQEADAMMRAILKTVALQAAQPVQAEVKGWKGALACLAMVALVIVAAVARR